MRWKGRRKSDNVVDQRGRRGISSKRGASGGALIILLVAGLFFGQDVQNILSLFVGDGSSQQGYNQSSGSNLPQSTNDESANFVRVILAETEDTWDAVFAKLGQRYQRP